MAHAPAITSDENARCNLVWRYGITLFNHGFYWESHEVLESVWLNARPNSRERYLLQGIIHLANAALKLRMHRPRAVYRLNKLAAEYIARAYPESDGVLMGLDYKGLEAVYSFDWSDNELSTDAGLLVTRIEFVV